MATICCGRWPLWDSRTISSRWNCICISTERFFSVFFFPFESFLINMYLKMGSLRRNYWVCIFKWHTGSDVPFLCLFCMCFCCGGVLFQLEVRSFLLIDAICGCLMLLGQNLVLQVFASLFNETILNLHLIRYNFSIYLTLLTYDRQKLDEFQLPSNVGRVTCYPSS